MSVIIASAITCSSCLPTTEDKSPQSHVPVCNADCSVCIVTKMCSSFWSSFIKLLMAHLLIVMTLIGVFLLSVCYCLPKETHLCCCSITTIYPHGTTNTVNSTSITASCCNVLCTVWPTMHIVH